MNLLSLILMHTLRVVLLWADRRWEPKKILLREGSRVLTHHTSAVIYGLISRVCLFNNLTSYLDVSASQKITLKMQRSKKITF
jgi:hypothetical protein